MPTGPQHYREAERLADRAHHFTYGDGADPAVGLALAAEAQVHATLALAAATALSDAGEEAGMPLPDYDEWVGAASKWEKDAAKKPAARCAECGDPVSYPTATYCSARCRNAADRHDVSGVSGA